MSLKMEFHSNGMSQKMECCEKIHVIQNGMSGKMECHSK